MNKQPLVSVITPTFNRAHTIMTAIQSVLEQTYQNWELLIIDDGSIDNTKQIVSAISDKRIKYFYKQNGGPAEARNYGIEQAKGKWILYLDSDDVLYPKCVATMIDKLEVTPGAVFGLPRGNRSLDLYEKGKLVKTVDDSEDMPHAFTVKDIFMRNARFACLGFTHLRRIYNEGIKWDKKAWAMEDWEFLLSIGEKYPKGFVYVPEVLYHYHQRFNSDNIVSKATYQDWADTFEYIYQKHKNDKMMLGQTWYPAKVEKWRRRQREFEVGQRPAYQYHYFQN